MSRFWGQSSLVEPGCYDIELFKSLKGRPLSLQLRSLYAIGCHNFEEKALIDEIFPGLESIVLFEPLPGPQENLNAIAAMDPRVKIIRCAIGANDGTAEFHVTDNDGESSSLLKLGKHKDVFPWVAEKSSINVEVRRLSSAVLEQHLPAPDILIIDVQGAEYEVLLGIDPELLAGVRLIYTEVSIEPLYEGGRPLADIEALLSSQFVNAGFAPLLPNALMHGNAVFVKKADRELILNSGILGKLRSWAS